MHRKRGEMQWTIITQDRVVGGHPQTLTQFSLGKWLTETDLQRYWSSPTKQIACRAVHEQSNTDMQRSWHSFSFRVSWNLSQPKDCETLRLVSILLIHVHNLLLRTFVSRNRVCSWLLQRTSDASFLTVLMDSLSSHGRPWLLASEKIYWRVCRR